MNLYIKYTNIAVVLLVLIPLTALNTFPFINADSNEDQSIGKWNDKCNKAIDKDSQDAARKADSQYDKHAAEGPLVQCTV